MINNYPSASPEWLPPVVSGDGPSEFLAANQVMKEYGVDFNFTTPMQFSIAAMAGTLLADAAERDLHALVAETNIVVTWNDIALTHPPRYQRLRDEFIGDGPADGDLPRTLPFRRDA
jgi:hypothetical protein